MRYDNRSNRSPICRWHMWRQSPRMSCVSTILREAEAGPALVELSTGADLLVVGSRGHGGLHELLLGSVGTYCARHSHCPIVIVR